jgi:hypothetical protein
MNQQPKSIRTFIGAKDYETSKSFYKDLGFEETILSPKLSLHIIAGASFYLQDYYVQDWVDNTMILVEVDDVDTQWAFLQGLHLDKNYNNVKLIPTQKTDWGKECLVIDPSGVLWRFAQFA